ncbi:MAG: hypothetical protein ABDI07_10530 [Candidatus Kryptonium sp.]
MKRERILEFVSKFKSIVAAVAVSAAMVETATANPVSETLNKIKDKFSRFSSAGVVNVEYTKNAIRELFDKLAEGKSFKKDFEIENRALQKLANELSEKYNGIQAWLKYSGKLREALGGDKLPDHPIKIGDNIFASKEGLIVVAREKNNPANFKSYIFKWGDKEVIDDENNLVHPVVADFVYAGSVARHVAENFETIKRAQEFVNKAYDKLAQAKKTEDLIRVVDEITFSSEFDFVSNGFSSLFGYRGSRGLVDFEGLDISAFFYINRDKLDSISNITSEDLIETVLKDEDVKEKERLKEAFSIFDLKYAEGREDLIKNIDLKIDISKYPDKVNYEEAVNLLKDIADQFYKQTGIKYDIEIEKVDKDKPLNGQYYTFLDKIKIFVPDRDNLDKRDIAFTLMHEIGHSVQKELFLHKTSILVDVVSKLPPKYGLSEKELENLDDEEFQKVIKRRLGLAEFLRKITRINEEREADRFAIKALGDSLDVKKALESSTREYINLIISNKLGNNNEEISYFSFDNTFKDYTYVVEERLMKSLRPNVNKAVDIDIDKLYSQKQQEQKTEDQREIQEVYRSFGF